MDLKELGKLLKEERLRQGLDLAEVMEKTKISRVSLEAMEEGNKRALPHLVYAKGFIKNYARFLGLDADKIGNSLAQIYFSEEVSAHKEALALKNAKRLPAVKSHWPRQLNLLVLAVLLLVVLTGAWFFHAPLQGALTFVLEFTGISPMEVVQEPGPGLPRTGLGFDHGDPASPERVLAANALDPSVKDAPAPLPTPFEALEVKPETGAVVSALQKPMAESGLTGAEPALSKRTLEIKAHANCWLSVQADAGRVQEVFLRPDERLVVSFAQFLDLRLGNAGGVKLFLDGKPWPLQAKSGEVLTLRFP